MGCRVCATGHQEAHDGRRVAGRHSPTKGHKAKGVAPLVLEHASNKLRQAAKEKAETHCQLGGVRLGETALGSLEQGGGQGEAEQAEGRLHAGEQQPA